MAFLDSPTCLWTKDGQLCGKPVKPREKLFPRYDMCEEHWPLVDDEANKVMRALERGFRMAGYVPTGKPR